MPIVSIQIISILSFLGKIDWMSLNYLNVPFQIILIRMILFESFECVWIVFELCWISIFKCTDSYNSYLIYIFSGAYILLFGSIIILKLFEEMKSILSKKMFKICRNLMQGMYRVAREWKAMSLNWIETRWRVITELKTIRMLRYLKLRSGKRITTW